MIEVLSSDATSLENIAALTGHRLPILVVLYRKLGMVQRALTSAQAQHVCTSQESLIRLHTTYVQAGSVTGRIYTDNPNLQCMPNDVDLRMCSQRIDSTLEQEIRSCEEAGQPLAERPSEESPWLCYVLPASSEPCVALATAINERSGMHVLFSQSDTRTLAEYWQEKGISYSQNNLSTITTVSVRVNLKGKSKTLSFPADRVWRCHGSESISPRSAFIAPEGRVLISADFSQVRLALDFDISSTVFR